MKTKSLGVLSVATNIYLDYWKTQAESLDRFASSSIDVTLHVFTDKPEEAALFGKTLINVSVVPHKIPPYKWPEATLYRYRIFNGARDHLQEDLLMYLDADMILHKELTLEDLVDPSETGMTLVKHPGYYRPGPFRSLLLYIQRPILLFSDLYTRLTLGGLGAWETRPESAAFVEKSLRNSYYCGGTWWGDRAAVLTLLRDLDHNVTLDESKGVMAKWHDESHINWWGAHNSHSSKSPSFCYSISYPWLKHLEMVIQAVDKTRATR